MGPAEIWVRILNGNGMRGEGVLHEVSPIRFAKGILAKLWVIQHFLWQKLGNICNGFR